MRRRVARLAAAAAACIAAGAAAADGPVTLRYGLARGQRWHATQTTERTTRLGEHVSRESGTAQFEYRVRESPLAAHLALEAQMLSQETAAGASPFDFSVIRFEATTDARGRLSSVRHVIGDVEPPAIEGIEPDPVAFRQMLGSVAQAWQDAVFWLPTLPEGALVPGDHFGVERETPLAESDPGVTMKLVWKRTYTLRGVADGLARFDVTETSRVESATAQSAIVSDGSAEGEAIFDLERGMWRSHVLRSETSASFTGAFGVDEHEATSTSTTRIEMERIEP